MKLFLSIKSLHARLGDLWWYSAMIFISCRSGDVINAFIGLWLVPRYVGPQELGAVVPLQQLSSFFAIPLIIITTVFTKYVNIYATRGEYGKVKSFIHDVLLLSALIFLGCIAVAYILTPFFYTRLRLVSGALTLLILFSGFLGNLSTLVGNALQGLKKFEALTLSGLLSAPVRLVTLLVAMPFRALSGYLLGQTTPPASTTLIAAVALRRSLKDVKADDSWRKDLGEIVRYLVPSAAYMSLSIAFATLAATIYRQRLPEIESAAYYLLGRFSDIAGYLGMTFAIVVFPLASEAHEQGREKRGILHHAIGGAALSTLVLAVAFHFLAPWILSLNATWAVYRDYAGLLSWMTLNTGIGSVLGTVLTYELACQRFGLPFIFLACNGAWTAFIVAFTGYEFFRGILPDGTVNWMANCRIAQLSTLTYTSIAIGLVQIALATLVLTKRRKD